MSTQAKEGTKPNQKSKTNHPDASRRDDFLKKVASELNPVADTNDLELAKAQKADARDNKRKKADRVASRKK